MFAELISILPDLSVGCTALIVVYLVIRKAMKAIDEREEAFRQYAQKHNHETTEVLVEARNAIEEASQNIKKNNEIQEKMLEKFLND